MHTDIPQMKYMYIQPKLNYLSQLRIRRPPSLPAIPPNPLLHPLTPLRKDHCCMKDAQCAESNENSIFRFLRFLVLELW